MSISGDEYLKVSTSRFSLKTHQIYIFEVKSVLNYQSPTKTVFGTTNYCVLLDGTGLGVSSPLSIGFQNNSNLFPLSNNWVSSVMQNLKSNIRLLETQFISMRAGLGLKYLFVVFCIPNVQTYNSVKDPYKTSCATKLLVTVTH